MEMDKNIKNYLGWTIIVVLLILAYVATSFASSFSRSIEPSSFRSFSVSGEGKIIAVPDIAQFTFSVITEGGTNIDKLQSENTTKMNKAIDFVKSKGVEKKDIKTENYNLTPRYQYFNCPRGEIFNIDEILPCPPPEIAGYSINQTVKVKIRDFEIIGDLLSSVIKNGANSVSQLTFIIDDPDELKNKARAEAVKKAESKARAIAKAADFKVGRIISIQEDGVFATSIYKFQDMGADMENSFAPTPSIEPGSQDITASITITYEIQ